MAAAWLGFAGIVAAGLLALLGVLRTSMPPKHQADIAGFRELLDAMRRDREDLRALLKECRAELAALKGVPVKEVEDDPPGP